MSEATANPKDSINWVFQPNDYPRNIHSLPVVIEQAAAMAFVSPALRREYELDYVKVNQRWWIEVIFKSTVDVAIAERCLQASEIRFVEFLKRYFLEIQAFDNSLSKDDVLLRASSLIPMLNSAIKLNCRHFSGMHIRTIIEFLGKGNSTSTTTRTVRVPGRLDMPEIVNFLAVGTPAIDELLRSSPDFEEALYFFSRDGNPWIDLYKAFEIIRDSNGGEEQLAKLGWCSKADLSRFRHTANHPNGAGQLSRHARLNSQPPTNPMTNEEAEAFVWRLLKAWSAKRASGALQSNP